MTAIAGYIAVSPTGGYANPRVTDALRGIDQGWIGWPGHSVDISHALVAPVALGSPAQPRYAINGALALDYSNDYYDRIHALPSTLPMGNLVTTQTRTIEVWNAWRTASQTLTSVGAINVEGITLDAPGGYPMVFGPLQSRKWIVNMTTQGPPVIDATLQWLFAGNAPVEVEITGNRLTAWTVAPDWGSSVVETLAWLTDVQQGRSGSQYREVVRDAPRRQWEFALQSVGRERQMVESMLFDWSGRVWALPVWTDTTWLSSPLVAGADSVPIDTAGLDYVDGGLAMLWTDSLHYEIVEIDSVQANALTLTHTTANSWPTGAQVFPCRQAVLTDYPAITRSNDRLMSAQVRMQAQETCDWPVSLPATTYLGYPVFDARGDETQDPKAAYDRQLEELDNDTGTPYFDDPTGYAWMTQTYAWVIDGTAERAALRSLLYGLQGRAQPVWIPTWADDLTLLQTVGATSGTITVAWCGVTRFLARQPGRRHLRIELTNGTVLYRQVTDSIEVDAESEQLALDSALGMNVAASQVRLISWMMLATLADDAVELDHDPGSSSCLVTFAGVPGEEP